ncbi:MAG: hypothetical protein ABFS02_02625 [Pseudomonadota bacterium]
MMGYELQASVLRLAKVTHVHPAGQHLDVIFLDSGEHCRNIQVMSPYAGTDFGFTSGIPEPEKEGWGENKVTDPDKRDIIAVVAYMMNYPICIGFLYPQVTHMAFEKEKGGRNRMIERSPSDHYRTIDEHANFEQFHPGDAWVRVGEGIAHEDLTGKDFDKRWEIKRNKDKVPIITLWNQNGGAGQGDMQIEKGKIIIEVVDGSEHSIITLIPNQAKIETTGDVIVDAQGNITATAGGDASIDAQGKITANAGGDITANSGANIDVTAAGTVTVNAASLDINAPIGNVVSIVVNVTAPDITLTGITHIVGDIDI